MAELETVEQGTTAVEESAKETRTFTQEEVDKMIQTRVLKEQERFSDYAELKAKADKYTEIEEANKTELQKATERADALQARLDEMETASKVNGIRADVSKETGVPVHLLTASTTDECKAQAEAILAFAKPNAYPSVRDAGESTGTQFQSTGDQFADWLQNHLKK